MMQPRKSSSSRLLQPTASSSSRGGREHTSLADLKRSEAQAKAEVRRLRRALEEIKQGSNGRVHVMNVEEGNADTKCAGVAWQDLERLDLELSDSLTRADKQLQGAQKLVIELRDEFESR